MLPALEDCRARPRRPHWPAPRSWTDNVPAVGCHGRILGCHRGLHGAMPTVRGHDVNYQGPDALTGGCHCLPPSRPPSIGSSVVRLAGPPVKPRREAPLNLARRLTETERPPPIRGAPSRPMSRRSHTISSAGHLLLLCLLFYWCAGYFVVGVTTGAVRRQQRAQAAWRSQDGGFIN
jgi:hypothetical protein